MISVELPDGSVKEYAAGSSAWDVASSIGQRLANACVAADVNGKVVDLKLPLSAEGGPVKLKLLTDKDAAALAVLRHSTEPTLSNEDESDGNSKVGQGVFMSAQKQSRSEIAAVLLASRAAFASTALFSCLVNILMLTGPLFMLQVYDRVLTSGSVPTLVALTGIVITLYAYYGFSRPTTGTTWRSIS